MTRTDVPETLDSARDHRARRTANDLSLEGGSASLHDRTVLVVEDNVILSMHLCQVLEDAGASVIGPFPFAREAMAGLDERRPDFAILDYELSGSHADGVAERLGELGIPFIFFTSYSRAHIGAGAKGAPIVPKPASDKAILDTVTALLAQT